MNMAVSLDHNDDDRTLAAWISTSRGYWGKSTATRCTFYGKRISQEVVNSINSDNLIIVRKGKTPTYTEFVAKRDFVRGLKRYIITDDTLKERKKNFFQIYLPPGEYLLQTELGGQIVVDFLVTRSMSKNNYIIETMSSGIAVYPIPDIKVFEDEVRKMMLEQQRGDDIYLAPDTDSGSFDDPGLDDNLFEDEMPLPEPPLE
jgi:hypothetical protein